MNLAEVAIDIKHPDLKKEYYYIVPKELYPALHVGDMVVVPFNKNKIDGIVTRIFTTDQVSWEFKIKKIIKKYDISISEINVSLAKLLAQYYGTAVIDFLKLMLPPKVNYKRATYYKAVVDKATLSERATTQQKVFDVVLKHGPIQAKNICMYIDFSLSSIQSALRALTQKGFVKKEYKIINRRPFVLKGTKKEFTLSEEQAYAVKKIDDNFNAEKKPVVLFGVTGSGKTEVYIKIIQNVLKRGKKALLLVPEISLTPQMLSIFQNRFPNKVAVLHSKLSQGERFDEWNKIDDNDADIVIGARSAVFAPIKDLGLIIVDEEHETSYKQFDFPFYDARYVAKRRALLQEAMLVFGSATPSVESYYKGITGEYLMIKLTKRVTGKPLPQIQLIDMRKELKSGNRHIFSRELYRGMKQVLSCGLQVILFLNRRGHSTFVICRDCGFVLKCPYCDISLTYHFEDKSVKCHYCGYFIKAPDICPKCKSKNIRFFGAGTEKVQQEVERFFPNVKTLRIDADSTSRKGSLERIISDFKNKKAQVLVGTQSVAKGLDFPDVALVGVITADTALNMPDFRAEERTFQLITQVAGRAGRGKYLGKVYVQTYCPESFAIRAACKGSVQSFYDRELENRRAANYPPFCFILNIKFSGIDEMALLSEADKVKSLILQDLSEEVEILGPVLAPRFKIKDNFRYQILVKSLSENNLIVIEHMLKNTKIGKNIRMTWDMDPQDMM